MIDYTLDSQLHVVFFTTENRIALANLAVKYWIKHNESVKLGGKSIIINRMPRGIAKRINGIDYIDTDINYCPSSTHFGPALKVALERIQHDYILFYCDDYITTHPYDTFQMNNLIRMMNIEQIDFVSFASMYPERFKFTPYLRAAYHHGFDAHTFFEIDQSYRHAYSVQPCIWRRTSLLKLLKTNPNLTLHALDNSSIADAAGNYRELGPDNTYPQWNKDTSFNFKTLCTKYKIFDLGYPHEYFILGYREIMRHGMLHIQRNDFGDMEQYDNNSFIEKLIKDENLENDPAFAAFLPPKSSTSHK